MNCYGYRFEASGKYHPSDPFIDTDGSNIFEYLQTYKYLYAKVKVTNSDDELIAEADSGWIIYPQLLAFLDIKHNLIDQPDNFNFETFRFALEQIDCVIDINEPITVVEASNLLHQLYKAEEK